MESAAPAERFKLRPANTEDLAFIFSTWLKGYRYNSPAVMHIPTDTFYRQHHAVVAALLQRSTVIVACLPEDENVIIGFAVVEATTPACIHWVYVKSAWRRMGAATALLAHLDVNACVHSHWTEALLEPPPTRRNWTHVKWPLLKYDPYLQFPPQ